MERLRDHTGPTRLDLAVPIVFFKPDAFDWPRELEQWRGNDTLAYVHKQINRAGFCVMCDRAFQPGEPRSLAVEVKLLSVETGEPEFRQFAAIVTHTTCKRAELIVTRSSERPPTEQPFLTTLLLGSTDDGRYIPMCVMAPQSTVSGVEAKGDIVNILVPTKLAAGFELYLNDDLNHITEAAPRPPTTSVTVQGLKVSMQFSVEGHGFSSLLAEIDPTDDFKVQWREAVLSGGEVLVITGTHTTISEHEASDYTLIPEGSGGQLLACYATLARS